MIYTKTFDEIEAVLKQHDDLLEMQYEDDDSMPLEYFTKSAEPAFLTLLENLCGFKIDNEKHTIAWSSLHLDLINAICNKFSEELDDKNEGCEIMWRYFNLSPDVDVDDYNASAIQYVCECLRVYEKFA